MRNVRVDPIVNSKPTPQKRQILTMIQRQKGCLLQFSQMKQTSKKSTVFSLTGNNNFSNWRFYSVKWQSSKLFKLFVEKWFCTDYNNLKREVKMMMFTPFFYCTIWSNKAWVSMNKNQLYPSQSLL